MALDDSSWAHTARQAGPAIITFRPATESVTASPANTTQVFRVGATVIIDYRRWAYTASLAETPPLPAKE